LPSVPIILQISSFAQPESKCLLLLLPGTEDRGAEVEGKPPLEVAERAQLRPARGGVPSPGGVFVERINFFLLYQTRQATTMYNTNAEAVNSVAILTKKNFWDRRYD
jgi:hypothetical protein